MERLFLPFRSTTCRRQQTRQDVRRRQTSSRSSHFRIDNSEFNSPDFPPFTEQLPLVVGAATNLRALRLDLGPNRTTVNTSCAMNTGETLGKVIFTCLRLLGGAGGISTGLGAMRVAVRADCIASGGDADRHLIIVGDFGSIVCHVSKEIAKFIGDHFDRRVVTACDVKDKKLVG
ncbi:uncharacterized protein LOC112555392 [Pomacea canaliculata]|uniref:uncharacterized protein LOC112555392 n=1 Tax=Pomacea canaliculata TaxID=400727 RepID=UPI000D735E2A|nr:uncharacterized protein LOC112555392 [Pomacea canaliculata]